MTNPEEIKDIIASIKKRRSSWQLSKRRKNIRTLSSLGLDDELALDTIYDNLVWQDYYAGPLIDNHIPPIPGKIWIFSMYISEVNCYLKFQDKPNGTVVWISLHESEFLMELPFRR